MKINVKQSQPQKVGNLVQTPKIQESHKKTISMELRDDLGRGRVTI